MDEIKYPEDNTSITRKIIGVTFLIIGVLLLILLYILFILIAMTEDLWVYYLMLSFLGIPGLIISYFGIKLWGMHRWKKCLGIEFIVVGLLIILINLMVFWEISDSKYISIDITGLFHVQNIYWLMVLGIVILAFGFLFIVSQIKRDNLFRDSNKLSR